MNRIKMIFVLLLIGFLSHAQDCRTVLEEKAQKECHVKGTG